MSMLRQLGVLIYLTLGITPLFAQDTAAPYEAAVQARLAGDAERAVFLLEPIVRENPSNVDARVQLGYAYLAIGQLEQAKLQFDAVLALAPHYKDASNGLALVAQREAENSAGRLWLRLDFAASDLTRGRSSWSELGMIGSLPVNSRDTLAISAVRYERFDLVDTEASAIYTARPTQDLWLRAGASVTPSSNFRPSIGLSAGVDWRLEPSANATILSADLSWRSFELQEVWVLTPSLTQYLVEGRISLTGRVDALHVEGEEVRYGALLRADLYPRPDARAFVGAASGPDTDFGAVASRKSIFGGLEIPISRGFHLAGSVSQEWRDGMADRTECRIGLKVEM